MPLEPTDAQIEAGNYRKTHVRFQGLEIAIENAKGTERRGTGASGEPWSVTMPTDYGYVKRTTGHDDEQVDCYLGPDVDSTDVWVIDQVREGSTAFDEHKIMLGFASKGQALQAFKDAFSDGKGADRIGKVTHCTIESLKADIGRYGGKKFTRSDSVKTFDTPAADATDRDVAEGIRDGRYASPQQYGDFWLFDLRVTGTGVAYRDKFDEYAVRDPAKWLSDEFVDRCNGLIVTFDHPASRGMNDEEFAKRAIGAIVLPYRKDDEVRGVAKIFDSDAARLMQTSHRSTSPGVVPPKDSAPLVLGDGTRVLDEDLPLILDHLAVCEAGVWDKNGPPDGIRLDSTTAKEQNVTEEERKALEKERDDEKARADSAEAKVKDFEDKARKDAEETEEKPEPAAEAKNDAGDDDAAKARAAEAAAEKAREDKARKDAAPEENVDADQPDELKDAARKDSARIQALENEVSALKRQPSIDDRNEIARAFNRADTIYQMLGDSAPMVLPGETPAAYRRRLASGLRKYSEKWKGYALNDSIDPHAFDLVENAIYNDATDAARTSTISDSKGVLREVTTTQHGKTRVEFYGDARAAWEPFMPAMRHIITKFDNAPDRGR